MDKKKIIVIGGGPAGMMAAIRASECGAEVTLIEKNDSLGRKLLMTGKGRCNLTNACELEPFLEKFGKNGSFLRDAFKGFFADELMRFFTSRNLGLKVERQNRVFPVTDKAISVLKVLERELAKNRVGVLLEEDVKNIIVEDQTAAGILLRNGRKIFSDAVVMATGGVSYSQSGSNGEGMRMVEKLGHKIKSIRPGLVGLNVEETCPAELEGLVLKNISLKFISGKKKMDCGVGELLFTDKGISGPLVVSFSGEVIDLIEKGKKVRGEIDLKCGLSHDQVDARLVREFKAESRKSIKGILRKMLPERFVAVFLKGVGIDPEKKSCQILSEERQKIVGLLKAFTLNIIGSRGFENAMVTRGGVSLKEINPRTMESRLIKNLYFAGEMIDIDGDTGGFNLQAAFSTGYLCGQSTSQEF